MAHRSMARSARAHAVSAHGVEVHALAGATTPPPASAGSASATITSSATSSGSLPLGGVGGGTPGSAGVSRRLDVGPHTPKSSQSNTANVEDAEARKKRVQRIAHGTFCSACVVVSLMVYSLLQERIMTRPYTYQGRSAFFTHSLLLVFLNRILAVSTAALTLLAVGKGAIRGKAPMYVYAFPSLCNVVATSCQYEALKWLTFPTVTIGKCAKMLPVMLILNLRHRKRYNRGDFAVAGSVIFGCAVMVRAGKVTAAPRAAAAESDTGIGFFLMATYLLFDALTSTSQERIFEAYKTSVSDQMLYINASSAILSALGLLLSGGAIDSVMFVARFPNAAKDIAALSTAAVAGQFAISHTIQAFGSLLYAGIMTARQFASVLASDILFEHGLNAGQWAGALLVFGSLFYKLYRKASARSVDDDD